MVGNSENQSKYLRIYMKWLCDFPMKLNLSGKINQSWVWHVVNLTYYLSLKLTKFYIQIV